MITREQYHRDKLIRDIWIILLSIIAAVFLIQTGIIHRLANNIQEIKFLGSFIAGAFFTSVFTTPIAIAVLGEIAESTPLLTVAFFGACGAVIGDIILFLFIRDALSEDIKYLLSAPQYKKMLHVFKLRFFRWLIPFLGALVIASPLPDELGIAMMGFSHMKTRILIPISFVMNFLGILLIAHTFRVFDF